MNDIETLTMVAGIIAIDAALLALFLGAALLVAWILGDRL